MSEGSSAHNQVLAALARDMVRISVLTRQEIEGLRTGRDFANLLKAQGARSGFETNGTRGHLTARLVDNHFHSERG